MECLKNSLQISALIILKVKLASSAHLNCFGDESGCTSLKGLALIPALDLLLLGVECSQGLSGNGILSRTYHLALQQCFACDGLYYDADVEFKQHLHLNLFL